MIVNKPYESKNNLMEYDIIHNNLTHEEMEHISSAYEPYLVPGCFYTIKGNYVNKDRDTGIFFVNRFPIDENEIKSVNDYRLLFYLLNDEEQLIVQQLKNRKVSSELPPIDVDKNSMKLLYFLSAQKTMYWVKKDKLELAKSYDKLLKQSYATTNSAVEIMSRYNKYKFGIPNLYTPGQASILTTNQCNAACVHCYRRNDLKFQDSLTTDEFLRFIDQCSELSVTSINLLGGEPLLREDLDEIISKSVEKDIELKITTNGIKLADQGYVQQLSKYIDNSLVHIQISIDGTGDMQDKLRPGADWELMKRAFSNLNESGVRWDVNTVLSKPLYADIENFVRTLDELEVNSVKFSMFKQCGKGNKHDNLVLAPFELDQAIHKINSMKELYKIDIKNTIRNPIFIKQDVPSKKLSNPYHSCNAMNYQFCLAYNLRYLPCEFFEPFTDSWGESFYYMDIFDFWHSSVLVKKLRKIEVESKCKDCQYNLYCSMGCPVENLSVAGKTSAGNIFCWYEPDQPREAQLDFPKDYSYVKAGCCHE